MSKPLRVLIIEDSEDDALLTIRELKKGGYEPAYERVETAEAMRTALREKGWDIILCDYTLPKFNGLAAIALLKETGIDLPLIIVSGAIGEETAVECMRFGACDYVMKGNLSRLASAIAREMKEAESRIQLRQAEKDLRKSEDKYRQIFETTLEGIYQSTPQGRYLSVNPAFAHMLGYVSPKDLIESITDIGAQVYVDPTRRSEIKRLLSGQGIVKNFEARLYRKDGTTMWSLINATTVRNEDGEVLYYQGGMMDITEHKRSEEALVSSEQRLSEIIEFLPDATLVIDKEGKVIAWNRAIEIMTGIKAPEILGKGDYEYALPFYGERRPILIDLALHPESEREKSYTHIQRRGDILFGEAYTPGLIGGKTHLSATASVLRDAGGEIVAAIECIRDDTQRRRAQEELKSAEERYRTIFENAQEGIYRSTPAGRIIMANQAMANMFNYKTPEELMTNVTDVARQFYVNPEERTKLMEIIEEQGSVVNHETQFHRKDGRVFWVSMTMQGVRDEKGQILYYEGIDEDITDRKEADERMRKSLGATVQAIAVIVETRDPYTAGHQRRVADLARAIATELKLPANRIDGIRMASSIHDLGKISVPAEILSNPKKLSVLEFSLIKIHAQSGYDILKDIEFPWPVARMIREHHERMDGTGYPQGLIGEEILLESRILAVADVVEAMASHRPYRPAIGLDAALAEMENNKGMLYDVDVVDACLRLFREKGYQLQDA